jgi:hypothetical protein
MRIQVFRVVMLCLWVSFSEFLKTLDVESSTFLHISKTTNTATQRHILEDLNIQQHSYGNLKISERNCSTLLLVTTKTAPTP